MDGPRSRGYGARSGYDVRTRCIRGCTERRQGVSPGRIRHETETARFCVGRVAGSAQQFKATRSASTPEDMTVMEPHREHLIKALYGKRSASERIAVPQVDIPCHRIERFQSSPSSPVFSTRARASWSRWELWEEFAPASGDRSTNEDSKVASVKRLYRPKQEFPIGDRALCGCFSHFDMWCVLFGL